MRGGGEGLSGKQHGIKGYPSMSTLTSHCPVPGCYEAFKQDKKSDAGSPDVMFPLWSYTDKDSMRRCADCNSSGPTTDENRPSFQAGAFAAMLGARFPAAGGHVQRQAWINC